jgi:hypothetical protein
MVGREYPNARARGQLHVQGVEETEIIPARPGPGHELGQIVAGDRGYRERLRGRAGT